jgi:hypothetical protein
MVFQRSWKTTCTHRPRVSSTTISGFGWISHPKIDTQRKVVALVERGGKARSFVVDQVNKKTVQKILFTNADRKSTLMTDEHVVYPAAGAHFAAAFIRWRSKNTK